MLINETAEQVTRLSRYLVWGDGKFPTRSGWERINPGHPGWGVLPYDFSETYSQSPSGYFYWAAITPLIPVAEVFAAATEGCVIFACQEYRY